MPLGMEVGLSPGDFVLDGEWGPSPLSRKEAEPGGQAPQFSAHVYCGQTAVWIKMALGIEAALGPGHIVLDGDTHSSPSQKGAEPPNFGPFLLWPNGCMDQDAT